MIGQIIAVTALNIGSIPKRWGASSVIIVGIACVVGVLISVLAMLQGLQSTMNHTGRADRAIVLRGSSIAELSSTLPRDQTLTIMEAPGVRKDDNGKPLASAELVAIVELPLRATGTNANVTIRGVGPQAMALRPEVRLLQGRMFEPGKNEVIVGRGVLAQFSGAELGTHLSFHDADWQVVGVFDSGDSHSSELWGDAETILQAFHRTLFQSVTVQLDNADAFDAYKDYLTHYPQLSVEVVRETEYFQRISEGLIKILKFVANVVGGFMALGALFGALNTMYSAVSARTVEIATLRAIGFGAFPVLVSVFAEAMLLSLIGAVIGSAVSYLFFNGNTVNSLSGNFTQVVFALEVSPRLAGVGVVIALLIGFIGGFPPALRAVRRPVVEALRAS